MPCGPQLLHLQRAVGTAAEALPPPPGDATECASVSHKLCVECGKMLGSATGYVNSKSQRTGKLYLNSACRLWLDRGLRQTGFQGA